MLEETLFSSQSDANYIFGRDTDFQMRLSFLYIVVFTVLVNGAYANQKEAAHAFAMHGKPKYEEGFKHFERNGSNPNKVIIETSGKYLIIT